MKRTLILALLIGSSFSIFSKKSIERHIVEIHYNWLLKNNALVAKIQHCESIVNGQYSWYPTGNGFTYKLTDAQAIDAEAQLQILYRELTMLAYERDLAIAFAKEGRKVKRRK